MFQDRVGGLSSKRCSPLGIVLQMICRHLNHWHECWAWRCNKALWSQKFCSSAFWSDTWVDEPTYRPKTSSYYLVEDTRLWNRIYHLRKVIPDDHEMSPEQPPSNITCRREFWGCNSQHLLSELPMAGAPQLGNSRDAHEFVISRYPSISLMFPRMCDHVPHSTTSPHLNGASGLRSRYRE